MHAHAHAHAHTRMRGSKEEEAIESRYRAPREEENTRDAQTRSTQPRTNSSVPSPTDGLGRSYYTWIFWRLAISASSILTFLSSGSLASTTSKSCSNSVGIQLRQGRVRGKELPAR
jgi:hypothetical protein